MTAPDNTRLTPPTASDGGADFHVLVAEEEGAVNWARYYDGTQQVVCDIELRPSTQPSEQPEHCQDCSAALSPWADRVCVRRKCCDCGRFRHEVSADPSTGPIVKKGEEIVVPGAILRANMFLTHGASFSQRGVDWLAKLLFAKPIGIVPFEPRFEAGLVELADEAEAILAACPLLREIDRSTPEGFAAATKILSDNPIDPGLMALLVHTKAHTLLEYLRDHPETPPTTVAATAWSAGIAASLLRFKVAFEEAAYRGHSFEKIRRLVAEWGKNQVNDSEKFWQDLLLANPFALSQLFAAPVVIHGERYLVGGIRAGGKHGKFADYLLRNQLTDAAIIVEIKTPCTPLLYETAYRSDVYVPSRELSGAVQQTLEQRAQFMKQMQTLQAEQEGGEPKGEVIEPHCVVIAGNTKTALTSRALRRSFESYRTELRTIRIVTFDELFAKLSGLAGLLGTRDLDEPA
jgi:hypothetical protein